MSKNITIYQINTEKIVDRLEGAEILTEKDTFLLESFLFGLMEDQIKLSDYGYEKVYECLEKSDKKSTKGILVSMMKRINVNRPLSYYGRNLSVSDIIQIDDSYYEYTQDDYKQISIIEE